MTLLRKIPGFNPQALARFASFPSGSVAVVGADDLEAVSSVLVLALYKLDDS